MQPVNKFKTLPHNKYTQLLVVLITNFVLDPFLRGVTGQLFSSGILLYAIIIIIRTFSLRQKLFRIYFSVAILAFGLETVTRLGWYSPEAIFFLFFVQAVYTIYLGAAAFLILRDILLSQRITVCHLFRQ
ncbi:MAG: hypothetical protein F6K58_24845 [Symploca sp. SIO2E9]|nr:hypothetical protein [Symploca sp. SIO2E9]